MKTKAAEKHRTPRKSLLECGVFRRFSFLADSYQGVLLPVSSFSISSASFTISGSRLRQS